MKIFINKQKILALAASGIILMSGLTGCKAKENKPKGDLIGFSVTSSNFNYDNGFYSHVINTKGLESKKYDFSSLTRPVSFAKIQEEKIYGSNIWNEKTDAFYRKNLVLKMPECYDLYNIAWFKSSNFDFEIKVQKLNECAGMNFIVVYSSMTAKRNLNFNDNMLENGKKIFYKGDNMSSIAIYYEDELVAYKQTGVGSDCENIKNETIGDVDLALGTVESLGILNETTQVSYDELYEYQDALNAEKQKAIH